MIYTLIIMMSLSGGDYRSGGSVTVESIKGFTSEQACKNAANKLKYPNTTQDFRISYTTTCVSMSI